LSPDINCSETSFTVTGEMEIRYGLGALKGLGKAAADSIVQEREANGSYKSLHDFCLRVDGHDDPVDDGRVVQEMLAKPFPWTVIQGVIHVFIIVNSQLQSAGLDFIHPSRPVRTIVGAITTRIDIRIGKSDAELYAG